MIDHEPIASRPIGHSETDRHSGVSLHIERLVLDGIPLPDAQATRVVAAVEQELTRLIAAGGLPGIVAGAALPSIATRGIQVSSALNARHLGGQIAQAVYSGLRL